MFQKSAFSLFLVGSLCISAQARTGRKALKDFPESIQLSAEYASSVTCSESCPEKIVFSLKTIQGLDLKKRPQFKNFLAAMSEDISAVYAYRISTPGVSGGENVAHPLLLQKLMDQLNCDISAENRWNKRAQEIIFNQVPDRLSSVASLTEDLFRGIFVETRSVGHYDRIDRPFPWYYPRFKPLNRYHGFSCYQQLQRDEDGVSSGIIYSGFMIGDEVDLSPEAQLPPVGLLANDGRIGFLILFRKKSWE